MIETLKEVREALEDLKRQYGEHPDAFWDWTKARAAITKLDALIAQVEKAEPHVPETNFGNIKPLTPQQLAQFHRDAYVQCKEFTTIATYTAFARAIEAAHGIGAKP